MKLTTILILGAAVLATPALAQSAATASSMNSSGMNNGMSNTTDSAASAALSSVPDTQKKYKASSRAADFEKEAATTQQLNQQVASAGGIAK